MKKKITNGVYVVVDPAMERQHVLRQLSAIRNEPLAAIQIWDNPKVDQLDKEFVRQIVQLFDDTEVPVLINNRTELLKQVALDGVHFDDLTDAPASVIENDALLKGITLMNDLQIVQRADELNFDYISFCSMFPSQTSDSCEIVRPDSVISCRAITNMPIFLSGGVTPERMDELSGLPFNGVAVVSAIMKAEDPLAVVRQYETLLRTMKIIPTDEIRYN